jgi:flagellar P-ring protein FlgI
MNKLNTFWKCLMALLVTIVIVHSPAGVQAARIKDMASFGGVRDNQLVGYGLVVGLAGTGDDVKNGFTKETLANMLSRQGIAMKERTLKADNVAAVMVTAILPPFAKIGVKIDVLVSSIGDATSLQGGTLLLTPLRGADGEIYAVAQGPITLGGYAAGGAGASMAKNHTAAGRLVNGASVEKEVPQDFATCDNIHVNLYRPDFTTAVRLASVIGNAAEGIEASPIDATTVAVRWKKESSRTAAEIIAFIENLEVSTDTAAVVVMNERTGTVVMGENVRISTVAVAHGNLSIQIKEDAKVSQPLPYAPRPSAGAIPVKKGGAVIAPGGQTVVTPDTTIGVGEEKKQLVVVPIGVTIQDVVKALNAIGVTPRDLITILQTIKEAGALQAELRVI